VEEPYPEFTKDPLEIFRDYIGEWVILRMEGRACIGKLREIVGFYGILCPKADDVLDESGDLVQSIVEMEDVVDLGKVSVLSRTSQEYIKRACNETNKAREKARENVQRAYSSPKINLELITKEDILKFLI